MDDFLSWLEENQEDALGIYEVYYREQAGLEGEAMQGDPMYYGDDECEMEDVDLYEDFAHCVNHSASYHGAFGVIKEFGEEYDLEPSDEDLQWEVLLILGQTPD